MGAVVKHFHSVRYYVVAAVNDQSRDESHSVLQTMKASL